VGKPTAAHLPVGELQEVVPGRCSEQCINHAVKRWQIVQASYTCGDSGGRGAEPTRTETQDNLSGLMYAPAQLAFFASSFSALSQDHLVGA